MPLGAWIVIGFVCLLVLMELHYQADRRQEHEDNKKEIRRNLALHRYLWATIVRPWKNR